MEEVVSKEEEEGGGEQGGGQPTFSQHKLGALIGGKLCQQPPFGCDWSEKRSGEKDCEGNSKASAKAGLKDF